MRIKEYFSGFFSALLGFSLDLVIKMSLLSEGNVNALWIVVLFTVFLFILINYPLIKAMNKAHMQSDHFCDKNLGIGGCYMSYFLGFWTWVVMWKELSIVKDNFENMIGVTYFVLVGYLG